MTYYTVMMMSFLSELVTVKMSRGLITGCYISFNSLLLFLVVVTKKQICQDLLEMLEPV